MTDEELEQIWREAQDIWGINVNLSMPRSYAGEKDKGHWQGRDPLAYIDLRDRRVVVNYELLRKIGAEKSLMAVLAHEVGHHARFPHTLGLAAHLAVMQGRLLPQTQMPLTNLFFDLLVNEHVGRTEAPALATVYRGFNSQLEEPIQPLFAFYLAIYEELWQLEAGDLVPGDQVESLEEQFPGFRAEAALFPQVFYTLPEIFTQFAYFCSRFARYLPDQPPDQVEGYALTSDMPMPDADDLAGALRGHPLAEDAIRRALEEGWVGEGGAEGVRGLGDDPLSNLSKATIPGSGQGEFRQRVAARVYEGLVEEHLIQIPKIGDPGGLDPFLPTTVLPWEQGDDPRRIDWVQSVITYGPLAGAMPLRRELESDPDAGEEGEVPSLELFLDTSGSMPNPVTSLNAMTLAAQILAAAAIRNNGKIRAAIYSTRFVKNEGWMYSEDRARNFLLTYVGGGTQYPFELLDEWVTDEPGAIRVVISDGDFIWNLQHTEGASEIIGRAAEESRALVLLLHLHESRDASLFEQLGPVANHERLAYVPVRNFGKFGEAARDLAAALFMTTDTE